MTQAIIYKEWLKTRITFLICLAGALAMTLYAIMAMKRMATLEGTDQLWLMMLLNGDTFISSLTYVPLICGTAIGIAQMMPEASSKRLKLTLHLPCGHTRMLITMLATGLAETLASGLVIIAGIAAYDYTVMTPEMTGHVLLTALPWIMAGVAAYFMGHGDMPRTVMAPACGANAHGSRNHRRVLHGRGSRIPQFHHSRRSTAHRGIITAHDPIGNTV